MRPEHGTNQGPGQREPWGAGRQPGHTDLGQSPPRPVVNGRGRKKEGQRKTQPVKKSISPSTPLLSQFFYSLPKVRYLTAHNAPAMETPGVHGDFRAAGGCGGHNSSHQTAGVPVRTCIRLEAPVWHEGLGRQLLLR